MRKSVAEAARELAYDLADRGFVTRSDYRNTESIAADAIATFAHEQRLALLQSLLDEELNTHGGKSSAVGTWLRKRMEEEKARG